MISGLKSLFQRRVSGSTVAPATPNAAPVPAGLVAMTPAEAAEHARKLDERKAAFHAKQAQQPTPRSTKTETTKVEAPKVSASIETPKPAPKPDPIAQASASESIAPAKVTQETPKASVATASGTEAPKQAPVSMLGHPRATVANASTASAPKTQSLVEFGCRRSFLRGTVADYLEDPGIGKHHSRMVSYLHDFCQPFAPNSNQPKADTVALVCTWGDPERLRQRIISTPGFKPVSFSSQRQWSDNFAVLSFGNSLDPAFVANTLQQQVRQQRPSLVLIWDADQLDETFGNEIRVRSTLGQIASKTESLILVYRQIGR